jgi:hypothetical protein
MALKHHKIAVALLLGNGMALMASMMPSAWTSEAM